MTNRTATTAAIVLSLAAGGAPAASAMPAGPGGFVPTGKQASARVYDRPDREMIPVSPPPSAEPIANTSITRPVVHVLTPNTGFDWGDAGLGAAGGLTLSLIAVGGAFAVSGRRSRRSTAVPS
jgi:hypothetical protein